MTNDAPIDITEASASVVRVTHDNVPATMPVLAPDGSVLLYTSQTYEGFDLIGCEPNALAFRKPYAASNQRARSADWLHDGSAFVFTTSAGLLISHTKIPMGETTVIAAANVAPDADHPSVSPDGARVLVQVTKDGRHQIAVVDLDGKNFTVLGDGESPAWSPDGTTLAFTRRAGAYAQVFVADATGGSRLDQVTHSNADHVEPAWSPDGRYLVYSSNRGARALHGNPKDTWNLYAIKIGAKDKPIRLTETAAAARGASWGRDGWIYFWSTALGNQDIWRVKPKGDLEAAASLKNAIPMVKARLPPGPLLKKDFPKDPPRSPEDGDEGMPTAPPPGAPENPEAP
jgi:WD40 repeat protein